MTTRTPSDESELEAVYAALAPYRWRSFTPELLARVFLAALDRHGLQRLLGGVPGAVAGPWEPLAPVAAHDARVRPLVVSMSTHRWTGLTPAGLCRNLLDVLEG